MRKTAYIASVAICVGFFTACSEQQDSKSEYVVKTAAKPQDLNPTKDPKIDEGIKRQREEYEERKAAAIDAEKSKNYQIDKSGAGGKGPPTSGGYTPSGVDSDPNKNKN